MNSAEKHAGCNYCAPVISRKDPYRLEKPYWNSTVVKCFKKKSSVACHPGCRHFETCAPKECGPYYTPGVGATPDCLGCPAGSFPPRLVNSAVMPVYVKPQLHCDHPCNRVNFHSLPVMKPMCVGKPPISAEWRIDDAFDRQNCNKGAPWKYCVRPPNGQVHHRDMFITDCVTSRNPKVCPIDDPHNDCYQSGDFIVSSFSRPPCYGGGAFGPCEESYPQESHRSTWTGFCVFDKD